MGWYEERNNDGKEETLNFGEEESGKIRMLGSWMGWKEDVDERLKRGNRAWWRTKNRLKGAKFSKRIQARVVEACVESTLLFDCQARTWYVGEIDRLQRFIDNAYRYIWSNKNKPPLRQMEEEGRNMADVRKELGVKSLRWKIEKRVLERIGHIMRLDDERMVKSMVLGWMEELENWERKPGRTRKTVLYWKKILREADIDYTNIAALTKDRKAWKELVRKRMAHLDKYEKSKGHKWAGAVIRRNEWRAETGVYVCDVCGKVCKNKGGLTIHRKRMHEISSLKRVFPCGFCNEVFKQEANMINHKKWKHDVAPPTARVHQRKRKPCQRCGKIMNESNIPRHKRESCPMR